MHTPRYVEKLKTGTLSAREQLELEVPYSPELVSAFWLAAGGSMLAADHALNDGMAISIGGGFHHAFPDHGEGFCMIHDVAVAIRCMQRDGKIRTAMFKPPSSLDLNLPDEMGDGEYLACLGDALSLGLSKLHPELICYLAGADPYREDQLGGLSLTIEGLKERDALVFGIAKAEGIPVMVTLAGGYALKLEDTITIHCNTVVAAKEVFGWKG